MTARNPTGPTQWLNEDLLLSGRKIIETIPDLIFTDLQYCRDAGQMEVAQRFSVAKTNIASPVWTEFARYPLQLKDRAGSGGTVSLKWAPHCWVDPGVTASIRMVSPTTTTTKTGITNTSSDWLAFVTSHIENSDGVDVDLVFEFARTAGTDYVYCDSLLVLAVED